MFSFLLEKILTLISIIIIFPWYSFIGLFKSYSEIGNFNRVQQNWAPASCKYLKIKLKKIPSQHTIKEQKVMFLFNHRSWADFMIHPMIVGGKVNFLSRREVALMFGIVSYFSRKVVWFFNRSGNTDIDKFNQWLDRKFEESPHSRLIVYPEGHRMYGTTTVEKEKIKRGMIKYAFLRKIPVQFIMTFGNEHAFNEKKFKISYGEDITYKVGKIIDPKNYEDSGKFVNDAVDEFIRFFGETMDNVEKKVQAQDVTDKAFQGIGFKKK